MPHDFTYMSNLKEQQPNKLIERADWWLPETEMGMGEGGKRVKMYRLVVMQLMSPGDVMYPGWL